MVKYSHLKQNLEAWAGKKTELKKFDLNVEKIPFKCRHEKGDCTKCVLNCDEILALLV